MSDRFQPYSQPYNMYMPRRTRPMADVPNYGAAGRINLLSPLHWDRELPSFSFLPTSATPLYDQHSGWHFPVLAPISLPAHSDSAPTDSGYYPQIREPANLVLDHPENCQRLAREFNESHRHTHVTAIQQDNRGRMWHVALKQCADDFLWSELRKSETPPRFLFTWNSTDRQHELKVTLDGYMWEC